MATNHKTNYKIRQPIVTVAGHVDHGKTTILDNIRKTGIQEKEAGGITQKISFTKVPLENIKKRCPELQNNKLDFPGFLFIDTPGHAAFSHLRKRGGSLADLAILVIDINEGLMPQTIEVIEILKLNKIPFIIALNKIDNIFGWIKKSGSLKENIQEQLKNTQLDFNEKLLMIISSLYHQGFNAKPFYEITDFATQLALIPCSGKTGEGIKEILMMLCGLSQKFLHENLKFKKETRGIILEIKKEKSMKYIEAILYNGILKSGDKIAIASFEDPLITKIRVLEEIESISNKFKPVIEAHAANGIRMQLINSEKILPGMPFTVFKDNLKEIQEEFKKEIQEKINTDKEGIIVKADSLGSLEALIKLLKQEHIKIVYAGIGSINKRDLISAKTNLKIDPLNSAIVGFNTEEDEEVKNMDKGKVKIIKNEVIYKLIEDLLEFQKEKANEIKKEKMLGLATICKLKILKQYVFRNSKPAIFGVQIIGGKLKSRIPLINEENISKSKIKVIQENNKKVDEAIKDQEVAISLPNILFDKQLEDSEYLYSDISEKQFKEFKKNKDILTIDEVRIIQEIAKIKRNNNPSWGI